MAQFTRAFTLMAKPSSSICNIHCQYCFYVEKDLSKNTTMSDEVLEAYVKQYLFANPRREIDFIFQGGEPTLCGLEFFEKVVRLQKQYGQGREIHNHLQTNGLLLNADWATFLKQHNFLVGLSIDGTEALHDANRVTRSGRPTYKQVEAALRLLQQYEVEFNTLTVVSSANAPYGTSVYKHLAELGSKYMQFIPLTGGCQSLSADEYAHFMIDVIDAWLENDNGMQQGISVQLLEQIAFYLLGMQPPLCIFKPSCGDQLVLEQNGDVYACDHFVCEAFKLGNILERDLLEIINEQPVHHFGQLKSHLPASCLSCQWRALCQGGCIAHRKLADEDLSDPRAPSSYGDNVLCSAYQRIFEHAVPALRELLSRQGMQVVH